MLQQSDRCLCFLVSFRVISGSILRRACDSQSLLVLYGSILKRLLVVSGSILSRQIACVCDSHAAVALSPDALEYASPVLTMDKGFLLAARSATSSFRDRAGKQIQTTSVVSCCARSCVALPLSSTRLSSTLPAAPLLLSATSCRGMWWWRTGAPSAAAAALALVN